MTISELEKLIKSISYTEVEKTTKLFQESKKFREKGHLTKKQLIDILSWKSERNIHGHANSDDEIKEITELAFTTKNDVLKAHILTALKGVQIPSASAILMFYNPEKFPVIDIRVWKKLKKAKLVKTNEKGKNFKLSEWATYLELIHTFAKDLRMTAREVEKRLYDDTSIEIEY